MKKFILCKLCLIVFGALLAVQNVNASPYKKLWESVSDGVTEMVSGKAGLLMKKKYCRIGDDGSWMLLIDGRLVVGGQWAFTVKALDDDYIEIQHRHGNTFVLPVTEGLLSSYEAKMPDGLTLLHCSDSRATIKLN